MRVGELVLKSSQTDPGLIPSIIPSGPIATASTSTGPGREVNMTSE